MLRNRMGEKDPNADMYKISLNVVSIMCLCVSLIGLTQAIPSADYFNIVLFSIVCGSSASSLFMVNVVL